MGKVAGGKAKEKAGPVRAYRELEGVLKGEIAKGGYRVGERLPTEAQLAGAHGVSRATVRAALDQLEKLGMIVRRPRVGTVVRSRVPDARYAVSVGSLSELLVFLDSTHVRPVDSGEVAASAELAADLGCEPGDPWIRVRTLRTPAGDKLPISWTEYYLQPRFRAVVEQMGLRAGPVYPLLEKRYKVAISRIEQDIGACAMPAGIARRLAAEPGSPTLRVIHRMISSTDGTLYCTVSLYPAGRFRYVQALKRAQ